MEFLEVIRLNFGVFLFNFIVGFLFVNDLLYRDNDPSTALVVHGAEKV